MQLPEGYGTITTKVVLANIARIKNELNRADFKKLLSDYEQHQKRIEKQLISERVRVCPLSQKEIQYKLSSLDVEELKRSINQEFISPSVMMIGSCISDAIISLPPSEIGQLTNSERLREWFNSLHQIGGESVEGYAMLASLKQAKDLFVIKASRDNRDDSLGHELLVGVLGTNKLRSVIPNFAYIYGGFKCSQPLIDPNKNVISWCANDREEEVNYVIYENISPSISAEKYLENVTSRQFLSIYMQLLYSLLMAQRVCDFTHYDLHLQNILIREIPSKEFYIPYITENNITEYLLCERIATIIDYGFSHIGVRMKNGVIEHLGKFGNPGIMANSVFPDRSFPFYDAYKFLCNSMIVLANSNNILAFREAEKIMKFFNNIEPIGDIITKQNSLFYSLPLNNITGNWKLKSFISYIRKVCDTSFIVTIPTDPSIKILSCTGTNICPTVTEIINDIELNNSVIPDNLFDFLDAYSIIKTDKERVKRYIRRFNYEEALTNEINNLTIKLNKITNTINSLPMIDLSKISIQQIFNINTMREYRSLLFQLSDIADTRERINTSIKVLRKVSSLYNDIPRVERIINRTKNYLSSLKPKLENAINRAINGYRRLDAIKSFPREVAWYGDKRFKTPFFIPDMKKW